MAGLVGHMVLDVEEDARAAVGVGQEGQLGAHEADERRHRKAHAQVARIHGRPHLLREQNLLHCNQKNPDSMMFWKTGVGSPVIVCDHCH